MHKVYKIVSQIPKGKVITYGEVALLAGTGPRVVGNLLHQNPYEDKVPCHRVVSNQGKLAPHYAFGGEEVQFLKLKKEGVTFRLDRVDLKKSLWNPKEKL